MLIDEYMLLTATPTLTPFDLTSPKGEAAAGGTDAFAPLMAALLPPTDGAPAVTGPLAPATLPPGKPTPPGNPLPPLAASGPLVEMEVPTPEAVPATAQPAPPKFLPPVTVIPRAPDILVDEQEPTPPQPTQPQPTPVLVRPTLPVRTDAPATGKPRARRTESGTDDAAPTPPSPEPVQSTDVAPVLASPVDTLLVGGAAPAPTEQGLLVGAALVSAFTPTPGAQITPSGSPSRDSADPRTISVAGAAAPLRPAMPPIVGERSPAAEPVAASVANAIPVDPLPTPGHGTPGARSATTDAVDGGAVQTAPVPVASQTIATRTVGPASPADATQPSPARVDTTVPPTTQTTQSRTSGQSPATPEIAPSAFSPVPQAGGGRPTALPSATVDTAGATPARAMPSPATRAIVPPVGLTTAAMQAASPPVAGAARIVRPLTARTDTAAASTAATAWVDAPLPVGIAVPAAASPPMAQPAASPEPVMPDAAATGPTAQASPTAPVLAPARPPAAPVILPAAQAFGAAIARALADERTPTIDPAAPVPMPVMAAFAPAAAAPIAVDATPLDMRTPSWPHAMAQRIEQLRDMADAGDTRIRLIPDALGAIDVSVRREGDAVRVHFAAEQPATRQLLQDAQSRLHEAAEARGLKLARSEVDQGTSGSTNTGGAATGQGQQQRTPTPRATPTRPAPSATRAAGEADADTRIA